MGQTDGRIALLQNAAPWRGHDNTPMIHTSTRVAGVGAELDCSDELRDRFVGCFQCHRIKVGAALSPLKKQAHGQGRESEKSLLYFGCDFSGRYNFGKIIKIVATRCHILKLKCKKFNFGVTPPGELTYSAPTDP